VTVSIRKFQIFVLVSNRIEYWSNYLIRFEISNIRTSLVKVCWIWNDYFVWKFWPSVPVKKCCKSVNSWQRCGLESVWVLFLCFTVCNIDLYVWLTVCTHAVWNCVVKLRLTAECYALNWTWFWFILMHSFDVLWYSHSCTIITAMNPVL